MPWSINQADTVYDNTHPWDSLWNGGEGVTPWRPDPVQQRLIAQARAVEDPRTPAEVIALSMTAGPPADAGFAPPQPTIESVLDGSALQPPHLYDRPPADFSGTVAGIEASSRNNISIG